MSSGDVRLIESEAAVILVRLDSIAAPSDSEDTAALRDQLERQASQQLASDIFDVYTSDVILRTEPRINQQAIDAVHVNFP